MQKSFTFDNINILITNFIHKFDNSFNKTKKFE